MSKVSIITPSYNSSLFISHTIQSVLSQSYQNWEMIIVDDCSSDNSVKIIKEFKKKDKRIKLIPLYKNVGAAEARNIALREASGKFIAFLDSDDMWYPYKLEKQLAFMQNNEYPFTYTAYERINQDNSRIINNIYVPHKISYNEFLKNTIIGTLTVLIDKQKTGYFEMPNIRSSHDMALWCKLLKKGFNAYGLNEILSSYRIVDSSNTAKKWKAAKDVWIVYREIEHLNILKSTYYFICYAFNAVLKRITN